MLVRPPGNAVASPELLMLAVDPEDEAQATLLVKSFVLLLL